MNFLIAKNENVDEIYNIIVSCADDMVSKGLGHWIPYYRKESILNDINTKKVYLVKDGEKSVATFTLTEDLENKAIYLSKLAVIPNLSGKGIGTTCLNYIEEYCRDNQYSKIKFDVYDKSISAIHFYEKNGYKKTGEKPTRRFRVYLMEKELV